MKAVQRCRDGPERDQPNINMKSQRMTRASNWNAKESGLHLKLTQLLFKFAFLFSAKRSENWEVERKPGNTCCDSRCAQRSCHLSQETHNPSKSDLICIWRTRSIVFLHISALPRQREKIVLQTLPWRHPTSSSTFGRKTRTWTESQTFRDEAKTKVGRGEE